MKCKHAKKLLHIYSDGFLEEKKATKLRNHLKKCENCKKEIEYIKTIVNLIKTYPVQKVPNELSFNIKKEVHQHAECIQKKPSILKWFELQTAFAVFISFVLLALPIYLKGNSLILNLHKFLHFLRENIFNFSSLFREATFKLETALMQLIQFFIKSNRFIQHSLWHKEFQLSLYIALPFIILLNLWFYFTSSKLNGGDIEHTKQF